MSEWLPSLIVRAGCYGQLRPYPNIEGEPACGAFLKFAEKAESYFHRALLIEKEGDSYVGPLLKFNLTRLIQTADSLVSDVEKSSKGSGGEDLLTLEIPIRGKTSMNA